MARPSAWTADHIDYLEALVRNESSLSGLELSTRMSRHFKQRITPNQVSMLLQRMRRPTDVFYRNVPYQHRRRFYG